ncbi:GTP-binding protein [Demequina sediminicola]|uniref:GTP-binding protein n=1 Tax=Demequina sediminicola TaxID=1095026 RepID=UPI000782464A|nr:ATP/GTP-binding protein [Demequina sediminicola]
MTDIVKIVVSGPFGAGKTTFVRTACPDALGVERSVSDETSRLKEQTTVALDHGTVRVSGRDGDAIVTLFGTPGQERFRFMWPVLARGMAGYVLLVDASRLQAQAQLKSIVRSFAQFAPGVPFVVAANRWNRDELPAAQLAQFLGVPEATIESCDPRERGDVIKVLRRLSGTVEGSE